VVVIELVEVVPVHAPPASTVVQRGALILKCVEILSRKRHKLFEVRIRTGTCPKVLHRQQGESIIYGDWLTKHVSIRANINSLEVFNHPRKILGSSRQKWALDIRKIIPIKAIKPWMSHHLSKSILKLWATVCSTTNTRFRTSKQAGEKVDAFRRQLSPNFTRNLTARGWTNKTMIDY